MFILSSKLRVYRCAPSEYCVTFDLTVSRAHFPALHYLPLQRMEAIIASEPMEGIILSGAGAGIGDGTSDSDSELSRVSSSRFLGLKEDWWKEKAPGAAETLENIGASKATITAIRTRPKGKRAYWE
jgi:hypothetical protein